MIEPKPPTQEEEKVLRRAFPYTTTRGPLNIVPPKAWEQVWVTIDALRKRVAELERARKISAENNKALWDALNFVRQEIEEYGPVVAGEHLPNPEPETEALAIVEGARTAFQKAEAEIAQLQEALKQIVEDARSESPGRIQMIAQDALAAGKETVKQESAHE